MNDRPLMAKSGEGTDLARTLVGHTELVLTAANALFGGPGGPTRLGRSWLQFFGINGSEFERFRKHLRVAAAAHDWGKANQGFQGEVGADDHAAGQVLRHEHLSGLLLAEPSVLDWLRRQGLDEVVILAAVISHHVKASEQSIESPLLGTKGTVRIRTDHEDYLAICRLIEAEVGAPCSALPLTPTPRRTRWKESDIEARSRAISTILRRARSELFDDQERDRRRWIAAVRAALIVADAAGSASVRMDRDGDEDVRGVLVRWIRNCFAEELTGDFVWREVVERRIADLRGRGRWDESRGESFRGRGGFKPFQCTLATLGPRVLMTASCGAGKTLAAWNWITARLDERPAARVVFLYPTRATATEGFRDYVSWAPEAEAALLSGTAAYELQGMFSNPDDARHDRASYATDPRLFAIGCWGKRIFSATADQFFPFMQYAYGPLCTLPVLAESVLVVDEVHSFDRSMFATLKRFLREFPEIPVLCMTATLPESRRKDLVDHCGLVEFVEDTHAKSDHDSEYPRYHIEWIERDQARKLIAEELEKRRRVLWVSNRVSDCQDTFNDFDTGDGYVDPFGTAVSCYCYHSRFKLAHRQARHKELIGAFQDAVKDDARPRGLLGATTQVCEMSLDLDAEILVTELAPIASLIQRMGRCNRDPSRMRKQPPGRVYVLRPEAGREKPYEKEELALAACFVDRVAGRDVSQAELDRTYQELDPGQVEPSKLCPFLDSGPFAVGRVESFRETDEYSVPSILDIDESKVLAAIAAKQPIDGFVVPAPRHLARPVNPEASRLPRWLWIADGTRYEPRIGFDDRKRPDQGAKHNG
ncbi:CRISPR-associated helicase Cas3' [Tautonia sociabilis]|uniref:CRISPR-associated helicase Cas3 n=1 Tax=Tautonia sociabilis TaxID=2080755 RepID=A0A432MDD8_9BACT|nr:CRISPR-associated helicase Cas3' [Tautonia sociabilis]RUL82179.1 CRISPR-associated helicase Cas3' [Tautonia sociabilis]